MSGSDYMEEKKTLDASGFDTWSSNYDSDVRESDKEERYPFAAYEKIMDRVCEILEGVPGHKLLDVGIGTGKLARKLMANGYSVTGVDFSQNMLKEAAQANPDAVLITWDFSKGLPDFIKTHDYSAVLCNYAIHHLTPCEKKVLISDMAKCLDPEGIIVIGDVMTETLEEMNYAMGKDADLWDEDEYYIVVDEFREQMSEYHMEFEKFSYCSGVLVMEPPKR